MPEINNATIQYKDTTNISYVWDILAVYMFMFNQITKYEANTAELIRWYSLYGYFMPIKCAKRQLQNV